jgi:hypothetical protein
LRARSIRPYAAGVLIAEIGLVIARTVFGTVRAVADWWARRRQDAANRVRHALAVKRDVAEHFPEVLPPKTNGEAIIREIRRKDTYPDLDDSLRGISPWFKVELKGTYHRGVEVITSVQEVLITDGKARPTREVDHPDAQAVWVVGRIPFSAIEAIDWDGDEYYGFTHIYCRFRAFGRGPYEETVLYDVEEHDLGGGHKYHQRLDDIRWKPKRRTIVGRWRDRRMLRKMDRDAAP